MKNSTNKVPLNDGGTSRTMLRADDLAERWYCSPRHVRRLADLGNIPNPIKLGALTRWPLSVIEKWEKDGCPTVRNLRSGGKR